MSKHNFVLYEIMDGRHYHSAVMPSEGDPFQVLEYERRNSGNYRLSLVEVRNGERREVAAPVILEPVRFEEFTDADDPDNWEDNDYR